MAEETTQTTEAAKPEVKAAPGTFRHILGEKLGMTQMFDGGGNVIPVTAVKAGPCPVTEVRTKERDGYVAAQIGFGAAKEKHLNKADLGRFKKNGVEPLRKLQEFRQGAEGLAVGQVVGIEGRFKAGDYVDVTGVTKGHGFAGAIKRHNFGGLPRSHGASDKVRSPGSLASRRSLGRVLPGQRMAGHFGAEQQTTLHLEIAHVSPEENLIYIKGAVPGPVGGVVSISETSRVLKFKPTTPKAAPKKSKDPLKAAKKAAAGKAAGGKK